MDRCAGSRPSVRVSPIGTPFGTGTCPGPRFSRSTVARATHFVLTDQRTAIPAVQRRLRSDPPRRRAAPDLERGRLAFCATLVGTTQIAGLLQSTFGGITPGTPGTYPTPATVQSTLDSIQATLDAGDATVPAPPTEDWYTASAQLRNIFYLASAGYDLNNVPVSNQQDIVDGVNNPNPSPRRLPPGHAHRLLRHDVCGCGCWGTLRFQSDGTSGRRRWTCGWSRAPVLHQGRLERRGQRVLRDPAARRHPRHPGLRAGSTTEDSRGRRRSRTPWWLSPTAGTRRRR